MTIKELNDEVEANTAAFLKLQANFNNLNSSIANLNSKFDLLVKKLDPYLTNQHSSDKACGSNTVLSVDLKNKERSDGFASSINQGVCNELVSPVGAQAISTTSGVNKLSSLAIDAVVDDDVDATLDLSPSFLVVEDEDSKSGEEHDFNKRNCITTFSSNQSNADCLNEFSFLYRKILGMVCFYFKQDDSRLLFDRGKCAGRLLLRLLLGFGYKSDFSFMQSIHLFCVNDAGIFDEKQMFVKKPNSNRNFTLVLAYMVKHGETQEEFVNIVTRNTILIHMSIKEFKTGRTPEFLSTFPHSVRRIFTANGVSFYDWLHENLLNSAVIGLCYLLYPQNEPYVCTQWWSFNGGEDSILLYIPAKFFPVELLLVIADRHAGGVLQILHSTWIYVHTFYWDMHFTSCCYQLMGVYTCNLTQNLHWCYTCLLEVAWPVLLTDTQILFGEWFKVGAGIPKHEEVSLNVFLRIDFSRWKFKLFLTRWCIKMFCEARICHQIVATSVARLICVLVERLEQFEILSLAKFVGRIVQRRHCGDDDILLQLHQGLHHTSQDSYNTTQDLVKQPGWSRMHIYFCVWNFPSVCSQVTAPLYSTEKHQNSAESPINMMEIPFLLTVIPHGSNADNIVVIKVSHLVIKKSLHKLVRVEYLRWKFRFHYHSLMVFHSSIRNCFRFFRRGSFLHYLLPASVFYGALTVLSKAKMASSKYDVFLFLTSGHHQHTCICCSQLWRLGFQPAKGYIKAEFDKGLMVPLWDKYTANWDSMLIDCVMVGLPNHVYNGTFERNKFDFRLIAKYLIPCQLMKAKGREGDVMKQIPVYTLTNMESPDGFWTSAILFPILHASRFEQPTSQLEELFVESHRKIAIFRLLHRELLLFYQDVSTDDKVPFHQETWRIRMSSQLRLKVIQILYVWLWVDYLRWKFRLLPTGLWNVGNVKGIPMGSSSGLCFGSTWNYRINFPNADTIEIHALTLATMTGASSGACVSASQTTSSVANVCTRELTLQNELEGGPAILADHCMPQGNEHLIFELYFTVLTGLTVVNIEVRGTYNMVGPIMLQKMYQATTFHMMVLVALILEDKDVFKESGMSQCRG